MWAFGVLFYFMLNLDYPFSTLNVKQKLILIYPLIRRKPNFEDKPKISVTQPPSKRPNGEL